MFTAWRDKVGYNGHFSHRWEITSLDADKVVKTSCLVCAYRKTICKPQDHSVIHCYLWDFFLHSDISGSFWLPFLCPQVLGVSSLSSLIHQCCTVEWMEFLVPKAFYFKAPTSLLLHGYVSTRYHNSGLNPRIGVQALPHGWIQTSGWGSPSACKWKWVWLLALGSPGWEGSHELCWELPRSPEIENLPGKCWTNEPLTLCGFLADAAPDHWVTDWCLLPRQLCYHWNSSAATDLAQATHLHIACHA